MPVTWKRLFHFIYLAALGLSCGTQALHRVMPAVLLWCRAPQHAGSVTAAHRLGYSSACGILVLQQGIEPTSPALQGRFLTMGLPGESLQTGLR